MTYTDGGAGHRPGGTTGEPVVDTALAELSRLQDLRVDDHAEVFDAIHTSLRDRLAEEAGAPTGPAV